MGRIRRPPPAQETSREPAGSSWTGSAFSWPTAGAINLARIVQTMVYEDEDGLIRDILHPDNHAQVIRTMWQHPPSSVLPQVACPALIVVAGPQAEYANSEWVQVRRAMVDSAAQKLRDCRVHWVPGTMHDIGLP